MKFLKYYWRAWRNHKFLFSTFIDLSSILHTHKWWVVLRGHTRVGAFWIGTLCINSLIQHPPSLVWLIIPIIDNIKLFSFFYINQGIYVVLFYIDFELVCSYCIFTNVVHVNLTWLLYAYLVCEIHAHKFLLFLSV